MRSNYIIAILWLLACSIVFNLIANLRIRKILTAAEDNCEVETALNRLYGLYKEKPRNISHVTLGINISSFFVKAPQNTHNFNCSDSGYSHSVNSACNLYPQLTYIYNTSANDKVLQGSNINRIVDKLYHLIFDPFSK